MKPVTAAQPGDEQGAAIEAASMRHAPGLALFWSGILGGASWAAAQAGVRPDLLLLVVSVSYNSCTGFSTGDRF